MDHSWESLSVFQGVPENAIVAGHDSDGDTIYVGRAVHNGDMLPCKFVPNKNQAYVSWGGQEVNKEHIEVLTGHHYSWMPDQGGSVPPNSLKVGQTSDGEPLYVGRGNYHGSLTPGKVHPSHGCLYIPYGGQEIRLESYEVLTYPETWVHSSGCQLVPGTVHAGHDIDGDAIYVGRAHHNGDLLPAKVIPSKGVAYVCYGGQEIVKHNFELLVGYGYGWIHASGGDIPSGAVLCGPTGDGDALYIGRGHYNGSLTTGKIQPSHNCMYIPFGGQEIRLESYEALVRH